MIGFIHMELIFEHVRRSSIGVRSFEYLVPYLSYFGYLSQQLLTNYTPTMAIAGRLFKKFPFGICVQEV